MVHDFRKPKVGDEQAVTSNRLQEDILWLGKREQWASTKSRKGISIFLTLFIPISGAKKGGHLQISVRDVVLVEVFDRLDELVKVVLDQVFRQSIGSEDLAGKLTSSYPESVQFRSASKSIQ